MDANIRLASVLDKYEAITDELPLGETIPKYGDSTYNWRRAVIKDLREMLAQEEPSALELVGAAANFQRLKTDHMAAHQAALRGTIALRPEDALHVGGTSANELDQLRTTDLAMQYVWKALGEHGIKNEGQHPADSVRHLGVRLQLAQAEVEHLKALFEPKTSGVTVHEGLVNIGLEGGAAQALACAFAHQFKASGGVNYVEVSLDAKDPELGPLTVTLQRKWGKTAHELRANAEAVVAEQVEEIARLKAEIRTLREAATGNYWRWQGDGQDHLESLVCPVLIDATDLRAIIGEGVPPMHSDGLPVPDEIMAAAWKVNRFFKNNPALTNWNICGLVSLKRLERVIEAVRAVYYAAHWTPDRDVDKAALWTELRDACGFEPGKSPEPRPGAGLAALKEGLEVRRNALWSQMLSGRGSPRIERLYWACRETLAALEDFYELGVEDVGAGDGQPDAVTYQDRVRPWMLECFGPEVAGDKATRNYRFLEEALELVQTLGCTRDEALKLVDYVYGRPWGEPAQEVGGVMVTLAALCLANDLRMHWAGEQELARVWTKIDRIREKQRTKPLGSPLPGTSVQRDIADQTGWTMPSRCTCGPGEGCSDCPPRTAPQGVES